MSLVTTILGVFLLQQVYSPNDFTQVAGATLRARYDAAIAQGRRGADETFWVAYRFPVRSGIRIMTWDNNVSITSMTTADGIEWIPDKPEAQRVGIFLLVGKSDGVIQKTRLIDLSQNFRIHDRKVYWLGEPPSDESLPLLEKLAMDSPQKFGSTMIHYMSLHESTQITDRLLGLAKATSNPLEIRRAAITYLGREIGRQAGDELNRLAMDPNSELQRQAVAAISRRPDDDSIPALMRIAREHPNSSVRTYAIQLLGQKKDPRVITFFEQLLKK